MNDEAAKEPKKSKNDGQNRCRRCDRPLSNPNANYGWWCAQIVGANKHNEIVSMLDENAMEMYNRYIGYENKLLLIVLMNCISKIKLIG